MTRNAFSFVDACIAQFDHGLRTLNAVYGGSGRESPTRNLPDTLIEPAERVRAGRMMRVNHAGEVMAQALYHGQACMSRDPSLRNHLEGAAREEADHLIWCKERLDEFQMSPSRLNGLWYGAGWTMGALAARRGRGANLGLVREVEKQVESHLGEHLECLPPDDQKSRVILEAMRKDEIAHGDKAAELGAQALPYPARLGMRLLSKLMTRGSLWV